MTLSPVGETAEDAASAYWHHPVTPVGPGLVITHGAGSNAQAPILRVVAEACCAAGVTVVRYTLPFRQKHASGAPHPSGAAQDRAGLLEMARAMRKTVAGPVVLGGHSYGGRQASMLAAEIPDACTALLLLSYPLHPPGRPTQLRTEHFPKIHVPALFVNGVRDPFGSREEFEREIPAIPARVQTIWVDKASHDLKGGKFDLSGLLKFVLGFR